jgi:anthranilate phosphoribosyltransferase
MSRELLTHLLERKVLSSAAIRSMMDDLVDPNLPDSYKAALLTALAAKGETSSELVGFARELRRRAVPFDPPGRSRALDLCGSGGAPHPSFNVSTVSAFVVAASGQPVIKAGNRSARGHTGSSDLLEAMGLPIVHSRRYSRESFRAFSLAFLHAPLYHTATQAVTGVRKALGVPTVFNRLGPLSNPARVRRQVVGCGSLAAARGIAMALRALGVHTGLSITAFDGADEFSPRAFTKGFYWNDSAPRSMKIRPSDFLLPEDRRGDWGPLAPDLAEAETRRLLAGAPGARRGAVLLTSGAALWIGGKFPDLESGIERSQAALDSGAAERLLDGMIELARSRDWPAEG